MDIRIVKDHIAIEDLKAMAREEFGNIVKAVVDTDQKIMAIGGELHADEEVLLVEREGSKREFTWGINLYVDKFGTADFIEFDSMINLKPAFGNRSRGVEDANIQQIIRDVVAKLVS